MEDYSRKKDMKYHIIWEKDNINSPNHLPFMLKQKLAHLQEPFHAFEEAIEAFEHELHAFVLCTLHLS